MTAHIDCCRTALCTATDWPRFSHEDACWQTFFFSCKRRERTPSQARYLFTFLCLPLNTTAKAPCPTRSFLLYSKSPTVSIAMGWWSSWRWAQMDSLECCSPSQKIIPEQIIQSVQAMLLLALRIYFMIRCSCINKRCRQDMVHSHALWVGWDVWTKSHRRDGFGHG